MDWTSPANAKYLGISGPVIAAAILIIALALFTYIMWQRIRILKLGRPDQRLDDIGARIIYALKYGFGQWRQPRYLGAGVLHILLFAGFIILSLRSLTLIGRGFSPEFHLPLLTGGVAYGYESIKDWTVLIVLAVCIVAIIRRSVFKPARYEHPGGNGHGSEAYVILGLVSFLMITDIFFDGSTLAAGVGHTESLLLFPASNLGSMFLTGLSESSLQSIHLTSYWLHIVAFFGLLNFLPISKHFHVITAIPNVFLANLNNGKIKPVRYGDDDWMELEEGEIGVGKFENFTWKHMLDFFSCADCGRCSDNCPATIVGRSLSPKMISIKARDYAYSHYPVFSSAKNSQEEMFTGHIVTEDEIWACTTCGACERECPIFIEYIDKIVDMRRFLLEQQSIPASLQKPLEQIMKKGNAYGGTKTKRAAWTKDLEDFEVRQLKKGESADVLFFVDSCGSFDPRIQELSKSFASIMAGCKIDFGVLGKDESDSGNEVRRLGEEGLFEQLAQKNTDQILARDIKEIVAFDPHAYNALKNDYSEQFKVIHSSELILRELNSGNLKLSGDYIRGRRITYHDPCYLGRHNNIYEAPRKILSYIEGAEVVEMERSRSRSFCCSGGGLLIWYENEQENERMGELRVKMAGAVSAEIIVTACPFCLINLEDAVKTTGNEGKIEVIDMVELVSRCAGLYGARE